jgi:hypothetical protein
MDTLARWLETNDLRVKAERWRCMAILFTDRQAIDALNDLAADFDQRADELEAALCQPPNRLMAVDKNAARPSFQRGFGRNVKSSCFAAAMVSACELAVISAIGIAG